jgi:hypothetical protein
MRPVAVAYAQRSQNVPALNFSEWWSCMSHSPSYGRPTPEPWTCIVNGSLTGSSERSSSRLRHDLWRCQLRPAALEGRLGLGWNLASSKLNARTVLVPPLGWSALYISKEIGPEAASRFRRREPAGVSRREGENGLHFVVNITIRSDCFALTLRTNQPLRHQHKGCVWRASKILKVSLRNRCGMAAIETIDR